MALAKLDVEYALNECRIKLPGASDSGIKQEMWGVIREFLQDTNAWTECIRLPVVAGTQSYDLVPQEGGQIIRLDGVLDGNRAPVAATMRNFGRLDVATPINITSTIQPQSATSTVGTDPWYVGLVKNLTFPGTKDNIPVVPEFVLKVYIGTIVDGVLGKMMLQEAKSWTNLTLGNYHLKRFRDGIGIARNEARTQNLFGGQRWQFPGFARGTQRGGVSSFWPMTGA